DRLPLGLELAKLVGGLIPIGRLGERLGLRAQRFLPREVLGPDLLQTIEVFMTPREKAVACGAEPVPYAFPTPGGYRTDRLPLGLQLLDRLRRFDPARRVGECLRLLTESG